MFLIFLGAMGKSAQFPFHVWLPDAMEGPTPVSALIHAATMVAAGVFLVARLMPLFEAAPVVLLVVACVGLFTFAFAGTLALVMTDLKRVLAYSTISHLGLMMLSLGALGMAAAILHLLAHGISKALLFLGAGSVTHGTGKTDIREMGGLWRRMPLTSITFMIGAASLAGVVPLSGFFSKEEVLYAVLEHRHPALVVLALAGSILSVLYMARVTFLVFFGTKRGDGDAHESPWLMTLPLLILAPLALALGMITFGWSDAYPGFGYFLAGEGRHSAEPLILGVSVGIVVGGLMACWSWYVTWKVPPWEPDALDRETYPITARIAMGSRRLHQLISNGYYVDTLYQWTVDRVVLASSRFVALFDRIVVNDTGVDGSAWTVMLSALRLRLVQSGKVYNYGMAMAAGVLGLGLIWWVLA